MLHTIEHLRRTDNRLLITMAHGDDLFLYHRHAGNVDLDTQITAGHHYSIGRIDDCFEMIQSLGLFDLGDNLGFGTAGV